MHQNHDHKEIAVQYQYITIANAFYGSQIHGPMHRNSDHKEPPHILST